ncbi:MAG: flagellar filament capping protein FliD [Planctomycetota bacterium]
MTLGGIQFGGLASGLDTSAIIDAILAVEGRSVRVAEQRREAEQNKLSLLGTFEGLVNKLRDMARDLQDDADFFAHKLTVGEEGIATFALSGAATPGAHTLMVNTLASADRWAFSGVTDPEASLGTGAVSFTYDGTAYSVDVTAGNDNLTDIAAAINSAAGADVTASVINVGTAATPSYQLVIAGDDTGADFAITGLTSTVAGLTTPTNLTPASNAEVEIDGLVVQRSTNLFADVLGGVSFTVSRKTEGATTSFTVEVDTEGMKENLKEFVDAYNAVIDFVNKQNTFTLEDGAGGELFGDNALDGVRSIVRRAIFSVNPAQDPDYRTVGQLGLDLQSDGTIKLDDTKLEKALATNLDAFSSFFRAEGADDALAEEDDGLFVRVDQMIDDLLKTTSATVAGKSVEIKGLIGSRRDAIGRQVRDYDKEIDRLEERLSKLEESLVLKFANLERIMSGLQSQQSFLLNSGLGSSRR